MTRTTRLSPTIPSDAVLSLLGYMDNAIETAPRSIDGQYGVIGQRVNLSYVTAYRTQSITSLGAMTRGTAITGLTMARWGLYSVAANGDLTLVARTAQQGSGSGVYGATFTEYFAPLDTTGGFPASYKVIRGQLYAMAQICIFSGTGPQLRASGSNMATVTAMRSPRMNGSLTGQSDLPASITAGNVGNDGNTLYMFGLA